MQSKTAALPPTGIDLRAELADLVRARVEQARAQSKGDDERAARLLRVGPAELGRLEGEVDPRRVTAADNGAHAISLIAIKRLAADGLDAPSIGRKLGCSRYLVERALREVEAREIERLDDEQLAPKAIAERLKIPVSRVRLALVNSDIRRSRAARGVK